MESWEAGIGLVRVENEIAAVATLPRKDSYRFVSAYRGFREGTLRDTQGRYGL